MSNWTTCDKCKDSRRGGGSVPITWVTLKVASWSLNTPIHLCEPCYEAFKAWLDEVTE